MKLKHAIKFNRKYNKRSDKMVKTVNLSLSDERTSINK